MANRLRYLASLESGWDGYGGSPPTKKALEMCSLVLEEIRESFANEEEPSILPLADGGLQLDWYYSRVEELSIVIPPEGGDAAEYLAAYEDDDSVGTLIVGKISDTLQSL